MHGDKCKTAIYYNLDKKKALPTSVERAANCPLSRCHTLASRSPALLATL